MDNLRRRGRVVVNACPLCLSAEESVNHLMLNCSMANSIWSAILNYFHVSWVLPRHIGELFEAWKLQIGATRGRTMWRLSFLATVWAIWKGRNRRCFEGRSSTTVDVVDKARLNVAVWVSILPTFRGLPIDTILRSWKDVAFS